MIPAPAIWPGNNAHRVAVFQPDLHTDFERIEITLADALRSARAALEAMHDLPYATTKPLEQFRRFVTEKVEARRILNDDFRHWTKGILQHLAKADRAEEDEGTFDAVMRGLRDALEGSHRVADLLAAEKDVGWHRGIGR